MGSLRRWQEVSGDIYGQLPFNSQRIPQKAMRTLKRSLYLSKSVHVVFGGCGSCPKSAASIVEVGKTIYEKILKERTWQSDTLCFSEPWWLSLFLRILSLLRCPATNHNNVSVDLSGRGLRLTYSFPLVPSGYLIFYEISFQIHEPA